jgi:protein SCO1
LKRNLLAGSCLLFAAQVFAVERQSIQGILLEVNPGKQAIVVSCEATPGGMEAMVMPFTVRGSRNLSDLVPGVTVRFDMVEEKDRAYAEHLEVLRVKPRG